MSTSIALPIRFRARILPSRPTGQVQSILLSFSLRRSWNLLLYETLVQNGFIFDPQTVVANRTVREGFDSFAVRHAIQPLSATRKAK